MPLLGQDPNERYKIRPRVVTQKPDVNPEPPTAKVPEKVMVPVPVAAPTPTGPITTPPPPVPVDESAPAPDARYKINMSGQMPPTPALAPPQTAPTTPNPLTAKVTQPFYAQQPTMDTGTAPTTGNSADQPQEIPAWLKELHDATTQMSTDEAAPVKKDSRFKAFLKMLAYGAKDMPPARNWAEFAYGGGRALGSGAAGIVKPDLPGTIQKRYQIAQDQERVDAAQKTANVESQIQGRTDAQKIRVAQLGRALNKDEYAKMLNDRKAVAADIRRLPYIDPANPVHAKILARAKAAGIDVDPSSYGEGKDKVIRATTDNGLHTVIYRMDARGNATPVKIEGKDAVASLGEIRDPMTGQPFSAKQRHDLEVEKFDYAKVEGRIHDNMRERSAALQAKGMDIRVAQGQGEVDAIDAVLPDLEDRLNTTDDEATRASIQRAIATLTARRGRAAGAAGVPGVNSTPATQSYPHTEADVRVKASNLPPALQDLVVKKAREQGLIPPQ